MNAVYLSTLDILMYLEERGNEYEKVFWKNWGFMYNYAFGS